MKKVLIIGATSAIAKECGRQWAAQKYEIILVGRNKVAIETLAQDYRVIGASAVTSFICDLNDFGEHYELAQKIWHEAKEIDLILTAQGVLGRQETAEKNTNELLEIVNANYVSHISILSLMAEKLKSQGHGTVAVISSVAGDRGKQSNFIYGSAQAGKSVFVAGLRNRLFPYGVHVIDLKLGFVDTPMTRDFPKGPLWAEPQQVAKSILAAIDKKKDIAYIPGIWRLVMLIIKNIPEFLFKRLKL